MPFVGFAFTDTALDFLDTLPPKIRRQVLKKAKALHANPHPQGSKKLRDVETAEGEPVYRERSGDYRMKESDFDEIMGKALGVPAPLGEAANDKPKRLSAYPKKPKTKG